jgi:hypothetical protein
MVTGLAFSGGTTTDPFPAGAGEAVAGEDVAAALGVGAGVALAAPFEDGAGVAVEVALEKAAFGTGEEDAAGLAAVVGGGWLLFDWALAMAGVATRAIRSKRTLFMMVASIRPTKLSFLRIGHED